MGLSLLDDGCEGLVQLSNPGLGLGGISCLEGLLEGSAQGLLQSLGVGPAVDPGVVLLVGVLDLWRHDVSFGGNCPGCVMGLGFCEQRQGGAGTKPFPDAGSVVSWGWKGPGRLAPDLVLRTPQSGDL